MSVQNIRIVKTQGWEQSKRGWDKIDGLSILSNGWTGDDRLMEGSILQTTDLKTRDGKRKRGVSGWWWPSSSRSPRGTTSSTSRGRPSWPIRRQRGEIIDGSYTSADTDSKQCELWASLSQVADMENQDQDEPLDGGAHGRGAGGQHGRGGGVSNMMMENRR